MVLVRKLFEAGTNYLRRAAILFVRRVSKPWENALFSEVSCGQCCKLKTWMPDYCNNEITTALLAHPKVNEEQWDMWENTDARGL